MQISGILKTDGGPHSPEVWAAATISQLVQVDPNASSDKVVAARKLEVAATDILEKIHADVQERERGKIREQGDERLAHFLEPQSEHVEQAFTAFIAATKGTVLEAHFAEPAVQANVRETLAKDFRTIIHIERDWFAKDPATDAKAKAVQEKYHGGAPRDPNSARRKAFIERGGHAPPVDPAIAAKGSSGSAAAEATPAKTV